MRPDFYESALAAADQSRYRQAQTEQGLQGEIALLRLRLYHLLHGIADKPGEDQARTSQMVRIVDLLIKALRAQGAGAADEEHILLERALEEEARRLQTAIPK
jgi:hypothetical protein